MSFQGFQFNPKIKAGIAACGKSLRSRAYAF
jgi:hypothetical protein